MKTTLPALHGVDNRLSVLEADLTSNPPELPLSRDSLDKIRDELKRVDTELENLGADLEVAHVADLLAHRDEAGLDATAQRGIDHRGPA